MQRECESECDEGMWGKKATNHGDLRERRLCLQIREWVKCPAARVGRASERHKANADYTAPVFDCDNGISIACAMRCAHCVAYYCVIHGTGRLMSYCAGEINWERADVRDSWLTYAIVPW
jgi:hypothetical protein